MAGSLSQVIQDHKPAAFTMRALVFRGPNQIGIEEVSIPKPGPGEAVIRVTLTTICGTDLHILKGEYPVKTGLIIGHEPVGVIHELGVGLSGYKVGERVLVGAITPCGQCNFCLNGNLSQCGGAIGGWKFGNTINGAQAEYLLVPNAQANLAKIPEDLRDEQVVLLADIASTGISAAESADLQIGDTVAVFAQGPIGLCATAGAKLKGASLIIAVESDSVRTQMSKRMGADVVLNFNETDIVDETKRLTGGTEWTWRSKPWGLKLRLRMPFAFCGPGELFQAWVYIPASSLSPWNRSQPVSATTRSSRHSVRAARNACAG